MRKSKIIISVFLCLTLFGCTSDEYDAFASADKIDRYGDLSVQDYKDALAPKREPVVTIQKKAPPVPDVSDILLKPRKPQLGVNKTVSLSVTEDVPITDVFIELARLADVDIEIEPNIKGGVIFRAKNKPFQEVVERLADLAGLRYSTEGGVLRISKNTPFVETYKVNFLNTVRSGSGSVDVSANVLSAGEGGGDSISSGSSNSISAEYDGDIWTSIESSLVAILASERNAAVNLNRQAGMIIVNATADGQERVRSYISQVKDFYGTQVLIEAKIVEIQLADQFRSGVNWEFLDVNAGIASPLTQGVTAASGFSGTSAVDLAANAATLNFGRSDGDITAAVTLAQVFGTTKTLSSPRLMALNQQQAVLTFARNEIYYTVSLEEETEQQASGDDVSSFSVDSTLNTIPIGIILTLQPIIDVENNEIIMNVRPTLSRTTGITVEDPGVALIAERLGVGGTVSSSVPQVEVRELDSMMRIRNGEIMVIGGMIEQRIVNQDSGVPYLSEVPIFGNAFKTVDKELAAVQTVIFIKATIVPSYGVDSLDQKFYNTFTNDPRPLNF